MASTNGIFSVAYLFLSMTRDAAAYHSFVASLWRIKALPRVIALWWSALLGGILMMDNLRRRRVMIVNVCPMFLVHEESIEPPKINLVSC